MNKMDDKFPSKLEPRELQCRSPGRFELDKTKTDQKRKWSHKIATFERALPGTF